MKTLIMFSALLCPVAFAASKVTCDITNLKSARACIESYAEAAPSFEELNDGLASSNVKGLGVVLKLLGANDVNLKVAAEADFAGLMIEHGDEHQIYYFALKKGNAVSPQHVKTLNVADLSYTLDKPYSPEALEASTYFLGLKADKYDVYEDVAEALAELKD
ncbi:MAG TPA: hypothetical protein VM901_12200 [Bdellovibrionota bacterium]|jgi:hypothetical protein|nr:hypothetical protein [Bdellovibrionota bacterium]